MGIDKASVTEIAEFFNVPQYLLRELEREYGQEKNIEGLIAVLYAACGNQPKLERDLKELLKSKRSQACVEK